MPPRRSVVLVLSSLLLLLPMGTVRTTNVDVHRLCAVVVLTSVLYHAPPLYHLPSVRALDMTAVGTLCLVAVATYDGRRPTACAVSAAAFVALNTLPCFKEFAHGPLSTSAHATMHALGALTLLAMHASPPTTRRHAAAVDGDVSARM